MERRELKELFRQEAVPALISALDGRGSDATVKLLDAAYWIKGCSSLGRLRYAAIAAVGGKHLCLIDIKEAAPAAAPGAPDAAMPRDQAERVVTGARAMAPYLGQRMLPTSLQARPVVLRELLPQDLKLEIDQMTSRQACSAARYLSGVLGRAHGRQMVSEERAAWVKELCCHQSKTLDAPSWLWTSVVELIALHETAYLEHCRRYATQAA